MLQQVLDANPGGVADVVDHLAPGLWAFVVAPGDDNGLDFLYSGWVASAREGLFCGRALKYL